MTGCGIALALLLDVSGSISADQFATMARGHAEALRAPAFSRVAERDGIALTVIQFDDTPRTSLAWRVIRSAAEAHDAAAQIEAMQRLGVGGTHTGSAVRYAVRRLEQAPCGDWRVLDVVTDGQPGGGLPLRQARDEADMLGVRINLLFIAGSDAEAEHMREQLVTGGGFAMRADDWSEFPQAIRRKILTEVGAR